MKLLLTHVPQARRQYYGARALARLQELVEVTLHEGDMPLDTAGVIAMGRGVDFIIADRSTPVPAEVFTSLPGLKVVMRSAIDIRNIDVAAASQAGVLVTHAEAGFVQSVVELTLGLLVDLSRGVSRAAADYHAGRMPEIKVGRQLGGSTVGIIGYGRISRALAPVLATLGMKVLVSDPYAQVDDRRFIKLPLDELLGRSDYVVCLAIANEETENLMDAAAFARMKPDAFFINMSRGNLVDEAGLATAL
ncbi:MAG TPA: NAD(P)-dependent oxidoreductase, partial [Reyranella sp.]|nr:NAD(P)-dependent oxidoreductase [Reyranella sp.]